MTDKYYIFSLVIPVNQRTVWKTTSHFFEAESGAKIKHLFLTTKFFKNFFAIFFKFLFSSSVSSFKLATFCRTLRTYFLIADAKVGIIFTPANFLQYFFTQFCIFLKNPHLYLYLLYIGGKKHRKNNKSCCQTRQNSLSDWLIDKNRLSLHQLNLNKKNKHEKFYS